MASRQEGRVQFLVVATELRDMSGVRCRRSHDSYARYGTSAQVSETAIAVGCTSCGASPRRLLTSSSVAESCPLTTPPSPILRTRSRSSSCTEKGGTVTIDFVRDR